MARPKKSVADKLKKLQKDNVILKEFLSWCENEDFVGRDIISVTQMATHVSDRARKVREKLK